MRTWRRFSPGLLTALALLPIVVSSASAQLSTTYLGYVTRVVDGDTIYAAIGNQIEPVRYIGINAPELYRPTHDEAPAGAAAREVNRALVEGRWVTLMLDVQPRDRYGRLLAYVWVSGRFVNGELVRRGYAEAATDAPNVHYTKYFRTLESQAREQSRGLWFGVDARQGLSLPGAKTADSTAGTASQVQSFFLPGDAPIAKYHSVRPAPYVQPAPYAQPAQPSTRSGGMGVGGSYRSPSR